VNESISFRSGEVKRNKRILRKFHEASLKKAWTWGIPFFYKTHYRRWIVVLSNWSRRHKDYMGLGWEVEVMEAPNSKRLSKWGDTSHKLTERLMLRMQDCWHYMRGNHVFPTLSAQWACGREPWCRRVSIVWGFWRVEGQFEHGLLYVIWFAKILPKPLAIDFPSWIIKIHLNRFSVSQKSHAPHSNTPPCNITFFCIYHLISDALS